MSPKTTTVHMAKINIRRLSAYFISGTGNRISILACHRGDGNVSHNHTSTQQNDQYATTSHSVYIYTVPVGTPRVLLPRPNPLTTSPCKQTGRSRGSTVRCSYINFFSRHITRRPPSSLHKADCTSTLELSIAGSLRIRETLFYDSNSSSTIESPVQPNLGTRYPVSTKF